MSTHRHVMINTEREGGEEERRIWMGLCRETKIQRRLWRRLSSLRSLSALSMLSPEPLASRYGLCARGEREALYRLSPLVSSLHRRLSLSLSLYGLSYVVSRDACSDLQPHAESPCLFYESVCVCLCVRLCMRGWVCMCRSLMPMLS